MCTRGCLAVGCACFLAITLCQLHNVLAKQSIWSGTSVAINDTWVLDGSETLTFQNCTVLLHGHKIILKDRAQLRMSDCQVSGGGGLYSYDDSKINLTGVEWFESRFDRHINFTVGGASSVRIQDSRLFSMPYPVVIGTSGDVAIVSSSLSLVRQITGGSVLVTGSTVGGDYRGLTIGGARATILDSKLYGLGEITSRVQFEGDEICFGSMSVNSNVITIKSTGPLTICNGSRIEARSGGSLGASDIDLSASSINISRSSISSWCWGDWSGHLTLAGGSILIVDSDLWSRGRFGEPLGTSLRLMGTAVSVRNSNISAQGYSWPGSDTVSDLSLAAETIRITHSFLKSTANRPSLRMEGNATISDTKITVVPLEDTTKNRWITISYPALVLDSDIGPGPEFAAYPLARVVLSLQPPGPCDEVFIDLSDINGDPKFLLYDDGTHGDPQPGDGRYSRELYLPLSARGAVWSLPAWVVKGGRYSLQTLTLTVAVPKVWVPIVTDSNVSAIATGVWASFPRANMSGEQALLQPYSLCEDANGRLFVLDIGSHEIHVLNAKGQVQATIGNTSTATIKIPNMGIPGDIALDSRGRLYVVDCDWPVRAVHILGSDFSYLGSIPVHEGFPNCVAVDSTDRVIIGNYRAGVEGTCYLVYATNSDPHNPVAYETSFQICPPDENCTGRHGSPTDIAVDSYGRVIVVEGGISPDLIIQRAVVLDRDFRWLFSMGSPGKDPGQFTGICSVAVGPSGVFVAPDATGRISFFLPNGTYAGRIGQWGSQSGEFGIIGRVIVTKSGSVLVPERENGRIQEIRVDWNSLKPCHEPETKPSPGPGPEPSPKILLPPKAVAGQSFTISVEWSVYFTKENQTLDWTFGIKVFHSNGTLVVSRPNNRVSFNAARTVNTLSFPITLNLSGTYIVVVVGPDDATISSQLLHVGTLPRQANHQKGVSPLLPFLVLLILVTIGCLLLRRLSSKSRT